MGEDAISHLLAKQMGCAPLEIMFVIEVDSSIQY